MPNCYTCQEEIIFDKNIRSKTGKQIPLWPDKKNAHGHDDQGNPIRQPLPLGTTTTQQKPPIASFQEMIPKDVPKTSQGGLPLDTKRLLQQVMELVKEIRELREETRNNVQIDSARYENQMDIIYNRLSNETKDEMFKTAADIEEGGTKPDYLVTNHAKIADDKQNFMQPRKDRVPTPTKFHDESREKTLDERIPDNAEEFAVAQALKEDDEEGVIDEE